MAGKVLVSGAADRVDAVSAALADRGAQPVPVTELTALPTVAAEVGRHALAGYVQLPVSISTSGLTAVTRVRQFLADGLLARFDAAGAVLPALAEQATVVLVSGHLPDELTAPDDHAARIAILKVLAHAIRADAAPARPRVRVITAAATATDLAGVALGAERDEDRAASLSDLAARAPEMTYTDWRTELLGLANVDV